MSIPLPNIVHQNRENKEEAMNRIEEKLGVLKAKNEKALITYMTAGLPDLEGTKIIIKVQEEAGTDIIELGIPFSDPVADGPIIQNASYRSIQKGTNLKKVFALMRDIRREGVKIPVVFMLYYNTVLACGLAAFAAGCREAGVDRIIIPDLPFEEQEELQAALDKEEGAILIQLISPVSKERIPKILKDARGFVYCVSSMGVTGQAGNFHKEIVNYLREVKEHAKIPVMMGFGIRTPEDVKPMADIIDGAIVGTHFIKLLEENEYSPEAAAKYCRSFKQKFSY